MATRLGDCKNWRSVHGRRQMLPGLLHLTMQNLHWTVLRAFARHLWHHWHCKAKQFVVACSQVAACWHHEKQFASAGEQ